VDARIMGVAEIVERTGLVPGIVQLAPDRQRLLVIFRRAVIVLPELHGGAEIVQRRGLALFILERAPQAQRLFVQRDRLVGLAERLIHRAEIVQRLRLALAVAGLPAMLQRLLKRADRFGEISALIRGFPAYGSRVGGSLAGVHRSGGSLRLARGVG